MSGDPKSKPAGTGRRWLIRIIILVLILTGVQVLRQFFPEEERQFRTYIRQKIENAFPGETEELKKAYGLASFSRDSTPDPSPGGRGRDVVLVHGLDDPGKVWMNLAPRLEKAGYRVWIMTYPNDQPIVDSADLFLRELEDLAKKGIGEIDVVAHSMGGLVVREALTNPEWSYPDRAGSGDLPEVDHFIMVGTPNHGSQLARFRIFTELRDQWTQLFSEDWSWLRPIVDGAGEAGLDLWPDSRFLEELNARPLPAGVNMLIIIGLIGPWNPAELDEFIESARGREKGDDDKLPRELKGGLTSLLDGLGDGLVTVDSAKLKGVPFQTVSGNHLTIIRNLSPESENVPPAIPIILETLKN